VTDPSDPHRDLAGVLHDVSNALTVLLGWVGEARAPGATPESVTYALGIIEQRAQIARDLARHAIGSPRVDSPRELGAVVEEVGRSLAVEAQRRGVRLVVSGADVTARVSGSLDLAQVLTNLSLNAIAYAPAGSSVDVTATASAESVLVVVRDHGPGIAESRRESVFRGDSMRPGGTGVGLRHSRALARAAAGDVALAPDAPGAAAGGSGAELRVSWPRADALPRPPISPSRAPGRANDLAGLRVPVVEDDPAVTQLLEAALDARGAEVALAATALQLAERLESASRPDAAGFDAVLVDLSPIAADAPGALLSIRKACPAATIVLVTGNADRLPDELATEGLALVRKPFELREVLAVLTAPR